MTAALLALWPDLAAFLKPLVLSVLLGGAVGFERELHGRPAGLRTHVLVCLCSTMLVHVSLHIPSGAVGDVGRLVVDPNRLSAGIVTGIGFLGAAAVIRSGDLVRGVTTAACIWYVAGLGVAIGNGAHGIAVASTVVVLSALVLLDRFSHHLSDLVYRRLLVRGHSTAIGAVAESVCTALELEGVRTQDITGALTPGESDFELEFHVRLRRKMVCAAVLERVGALEGVRHVEWATLRHD